jgi:hypothetical protein
MVLLLWRKVLHCLHSVSTNVVTQHAGLARMVMMVSWTGRLCYGSLLIHTLACIGNSSRFVSSSGAVYVFEKKSNANNFTETQVGALVFAVVP